MIHRCARDWHPYSAPQNAKSTSMTLFSLPFTSLGFLRLLTRSFPSTSNGSYSKDCEHGRQRRKTLIEGSMSVVESSDEGVNENALREMPIGHARIDRIPLAEDASHQRVAYH